MTIGCNECGYIGVIMHDLAIEIALIIITIRTHTHTHTHARARTHTHALKYISKELVVASHVTIDIKISHYLTNQVDIFLRLGRLTLYRNCARYKQAYSQLHIPLNI